MGFFLSNWEWLSPFSRVILHAIETLINRNWSLPKYFACHTSLSLFLCLYLRHTLDCKLFPNGHVVDIELQVVSLEHSEERSNQSAARVRYTANVHTGIRFHWQKYIVVFLFVAWLVLDNIVTFEMLNNNLCDLLKCVINLQNLTIYLHTFSRASGFDFLILINVYGIYLICIEKMNVFTFQSGFQNL